MIDFLMVIFALAGFLGMLLIGIIYILMRILKEYKKIDRKLESLQDCIDLIFKMQLNQKIHIKERLKDFIIESNTLKWHLETTEKVLSKKIEDLKKKG